MIVISCDAPGCGKSAMVPLLNRDGRLPMPDGWWSGSSGERTLVCCSAAHLNATLAGQQPLRAAELPPEIAARFAKVEITPEDGTPP